MSPMFITLSKWLLVASMVAGAVPAWADRHEGGWRRDGGRAERHDFPRRFDDRYHHNRYYPQLGVVVDVVPPGHTVVPFGADRFYFYGGAWYRPHGPRFVVVTPPIGLTISSLPPYYSTVWVGGIPYYYADGVYYVWREPQRAYVVVTPPSESNVVTLPPEVSQQFIYPKNGQNEQQQATDRYECHSWAVSQTGFDPTQPSDQYAGNDLTRKRDDYQRASKACLEGRGYSVR